MAAITLPDAALNGNPSTKTLILCSKRPKTRVSNPKSAQKPRFCARNALKWGFRMVKAHKNPDFVLEMPKNRGPEGQKRTKTSILCSKSLKTRVSEGKSAQKCRFCARNAGKWGFQTPKKHKNPDFVLKMPENKDSGPQKRTKTSILCSKSQKMGVPKDKKAQKPRFCAREGAGFRFGLF